ncbi:hypothetical protein SAMN04488059_1755 [Devosia psychrophila]|uniref:Uncharacterized protein n=1 Tax=Devosia psychrophila TaxID=728005 RepID=A0A1I1SUL1_9HYPH|nr:hypothetical protein SAMN04488059_1755 [Devosia psychrophila]
MSPAASMVHSQEAQGKDRREAAEKLLDFAVQSYLSSLSR